jgi:hypothetical protein
MFFFSVYSLKKFHTSTRNGKKQYANSTPLMECKQTATQPGHALVPSVEMQPSMRARKENIERERRHHRRVRQIVFLFAFFPIIKFPPKRPHAKRTTKRCCAALRANTARKRDASREPFYTRVHTNSTQLINFFIPMASHSLRKRANREQKHINVRCAALCARGALLSLAHTQITSRQADSREMQAR